MPLSYFLQLDYWDNPANKRTLTETQKSLTDCTDSYESRRPQRHLVVAAALFFTAVVGYSSAVLASCGDYLLHAGSMDADSDAELQMFPSSLFRSVGHIPARRSTCENGRCQQSPLTTTPLEISRTTVAHQPAIIGGPHDDAMDHDNSGWNRPTDGLSVDSPFLEVAAPPPRHS